MNNTGSKNLALLILSFVLGMALTIPVFTKVPPHADEHQFYFNAFSIMGGEALQNYVHVAFTEYLLAAFFTVVNMFTVSGVNFRAHQRHRYASNSNSPAAIQKLLRRLIAAPPWPSIRQHLDFSTDLQNFFASGLAEMMRLDRDGLG